MIFTCEHGLEDFDYKYEEETRPFLIHAGRGMTLSTSIKATHAYSFSCFGHAITVCILLIPLQNFKLILRCDGICSFLPSHRPNKGISYKYTPFFISTPHPLLLPHIPHNAPPNRLILLLQGPHLLLDPLIVPHSTFPIPRPRLDLPHQLLHLFVQNISDLFARCYACFFYEGICCFQDLVTDFVLGEVLWER